MKSLCQISAVFIICSSVLASCKKDSGEFTEQDAYETWCKREVHIANLYYEEYDCVVDSEASEECADLAEDVFDELKSDDSKSYAVKETIACFECLQKEAGTTPTAEEYEKANNETCEDLCDENGLDEFYSILEWDVSPSCDTCGHNPDEYDYDDDYGPDLCCSESDPCDLKDNNSCDCLGCDWEENDCDFCEGYDGEDTCCFSDDPCGYADDGECDCDGKCSWDDVDCE